MNSTWLGGAADFGAQTGMLVAAFVLCSLIGMERQLRQKSAGYRTHVLVGLGACLFTLVSAYGFKTVLGSEVNLDPSRIAAQVVSGIGFLGAGVIFKGRNMVRGLTTAATVWVSAAVGMACGAGMVGLAAVMTVLLLLVLFVVAPLVRRLPTPDRRRTVRITYRDGTGVLRDILGLATQMRFTTSVLGTRRLPEEHGEKLVSVEVRFFGTRPLRDLMTELAQLDGVQELQLQRLSRQSSDSDDDVDDG